MSPRKPAAPKVPAIVKRAQEVATGEDLMNLLKSLASRADYYRPQAPDISAALAGVNVDDFTDIDEDAKTVCKAGVETLSVYQFVHPKVGVTIRLLQKEASEAGVAEANAAAEAAAIAAELEESEQEV